MISTGGRVNRDKDVLDMIVTLIDMIGVVFQSVQCSRIEGRTHVGIALNATHLPQKNVGWHHLLNVSMALLVLPVGHFTHLVLADILFACAPTFVAHEVDVDHTEQPLALLVSDIDEFADEVVFCIVAKRCDANECCPGGERWCHHSLINFWIHVREFLADCNVLFVSGPPGRLYLSKKKEVQ